MRYAFLLGLFLVGCGEDDKESVVKTLEAAQASAEQSDNDDNCGEEDIKSLKRGHEKLIERQQNELCSK